MLLLEIIYRFLLKPQVKKGITENNFRAIQFIENVNSNTLQIVQKEHII